MATDEEKNRKARPDAPKPQRPVAPGSPAGASPAAGASGAGANPASANRSAGPGGAKPSGASPGNKSANPSKNIPTVKKSALPNSPARVRPAAPPVSPNVPVIDANLDDDPAVSTREFSRAAANAPTAPDPTDMMNALSRAASDNRVASRTANAPNRALKTAGFSGSLTRGLERDPLFARRTLIPIAITTGVLLDGIGALLWRTTAESPWFEMRWMAYILFPFGLICLAAGVLNMLYVRNQLKAGEKSI